jgi:hypothetical protein
MQARIAKNPILKGVNPDIAFKYLKKKKAASLSGVDKARTWVSSGYNKWNTYTASSSGTFGLRGLFSHSYKHCLCRKQSSLCLHRKAMCFSDSQWRTLQGTVDSVNVHSPTTHRQSENNQEKSCTRC